MTRWVSWRHKDDAARMRLFCLPYAGGGTRIFDGWTLGADVEVCPVVLPGREDRIAEEPVSRIERLVPMLAEGLAPSMTKPFALYGHSMGGLVAFELARRLCELGGPRPVALFVSGCGPARLPEARRIHGLPRAEFIEELRRMNGTPPEFFEDPDLVDLLLPVIRGDFELSETAEVGREETLAIPLTAFAGEQDDHALEPEVRQWRQHTTAAFAFHSYPGDHFFMHDCPEMLDTIARSLKEN